MCLLPMQKLQFNILHKSEKPKFSNFSVTNLNSTWDIVLVTLIVRTVCGVGKVLVVKTEGCHRNSMEILDPRLGELEGPAQVRGVQGQGVRDGCQTWRKQSIC